LRTASPAMAAAAVEEVDADAAPHMVVGGKIVVVGGADTGGVLAVVVAVVALVDEVVDELAGANDIWGADIGGVVVMAVEGTSGPDEIVVGDVVGPGEAVELTTAAGTTVQPRAVGAAGPNTVPATAFVVWVPLADPPAVLTNTSLRVSAFCQYFGATSMTT
jgi:hypothetical protein